MFRRSLVLALGVVGGAGYLYAGTSRLPDVPPPRLTMTQVIDIAQKRLGDRARDKTLTLVAVDWHRSSDYRPPFTTGGSYSPANDRPNDYSWFLTYMYRDEREVATHKRMGAPDQHFTSALIMRIKDDGTAGVFIGVQ